jgi:hypothetical protein
MNVARASTLLVLTLAACAQPPKPASVSDEQKLRDLGIVMAVGIQETTQLKTGQWALYSVRSTGSTDRHATRIAVVASDDGKYWIENKTITPDSSGKSHVVIMKYQIDASAKPLQLWVSQGSARPAQIAMESPKPTSPETHPKVEIGQETITLQATGKAYECTRLTSKASYGNGRETTLVTWCSSKVPFPAVHEGKSYGGVVRRTYGQYTLELDATGTDAVAELLLPEK